MIRVAVEAASAIVRAGIEALLEPYAGEIEIVEDEPDVTVRQSEDEGEVAGGAVVMLVDDPAPGWLGQLLREGARAVLPTDCTGEELRAAIVAAAAGLMVVHPRDAGALGGQQAEPRGGRAVEALTARESEILALVSDGLSNKEIAGRLGISDHTVKFHMASILGKLGVSTRAEAVSVGLRQGLILL